MDKVVPKVRISEKPRAGLVNILDASDEELVIIGKQGIENPDGTRIVESLARSLTFEVDNLDNSSMTLKHRI